jgi:phospholipid/cholesterol/gamma-HCH transport system substrate-binding protein
MDAKREQALVGLFVLVASALLVVTVFLLSGTLGKGDIPLHAYFKNAGGLAPGAEVRYAGGPPVGRVTKVESDPNDSTRMRIDISVRPDIPVKTDSIALITSNSALGDNFLGIKAGSKQAPRAPKDATLPSQEYTSIADISTMLADLGPRADTLLDNLNDRVVALKETMDRVNDLMNDRNRANVAESLANVRGMLEEDRPLVHSTLGNINETSAKLRPMMDDFKKTLAKADDALAHVDATITENRPDLRESIATLRQTLANANSLTDQLNRTMNTNAENLDEIIENMRHISENMKEFTNTIKTRPYTLIRASGPPPHEPGKAPPK